jgi:hypothetical protein
MAEDDRNPRQDWNQARQQQDGQDSRGKSDEREREQEQRDQQHPRPAAGRDEAPADRGRPADAPWLGGG